MHEVLQMLNTVPYNSSNPDLPESYLMDDINKWGRDCAGFCEIVAEHIPNARIISGIYDGNQIHLATIIPDNGAMFYVDPFLRMTEPLEIISGQVTVVPSLLDCSVITAEFFQDTGDLTVQLIRKNQAIIYDYRYNLHAPVQPVEPRGYRYIFLHEGYPKTIEKKRIGGETILTIKGGDEHSVNSMLWEHNQLTIDDIGQMFHDAAEYARYKKAIEIQRYRYPNHD